MQKGNLILPCLIIISFLLGTSIQVQQLLLQGQIQYPGVPRNTPPVNTPPTFSLTNKGIYWGTGCAPVWDDYYNLVQQYDVTVTVNSITLPSDPLALHSLTTVGISNANQFIVKLGYSPAAITNNVTPKTQYTITSKALDDQQLLLQWSRGKFVGLSYNFTFSDSPSGGVEALNADYTFTIEGRSWSILYNQVPQVHIIASGSFFFCGTKINGALVDPNCNPSCNSECDIYPDIKSGCNSLSGQFYY